METVNLQPWFIIPTLVWIKQMIYADIVPPLAVTKSTVVVVLGSLIISIIVPIAFVAIKNIKKEARDRG